VLSSGLVHRGRRAPSQNLCETFLNKLLARRGFNEELQAEMDPVLRSYLLSMAGWLAILAGIGLAYILFLGGLALVLSRWWDGGFWQAFWISAVIAVAFMVIGVPLFQMVATLFRSDGGLETYFTWVRLAFFSFYGFAVLLSGVIGYTFGQRLARRGRAASFASALSLLLFLVVSLPIIDFSNACIIGRPFILPASC